jgi:hypothetical protein
MADFEKQTHSTRDFANGVETAGTYDPASHKAGDVSLERINTYERVSDCLRSRDNSKRLINPIDWRPPAVSDEFQLGCSRIEPRSQGLPDAKAWDIGFRAHAWLW